MPFTPINTQEEFDKAVADRITRERAQYADYDDLKKKAGQYDELISQGWEAKAKDFQADLTKAQQAKTEALQAQAKEKARADAAEQTLTRYKLAAKYKLPVELAERIKGDDEADMDKDAQGLMKLIGAQHIPPHFTPDAQVDPNDKNAVSRAAYRTLLHDLNMQHD